MHPIVCARTDAKDKHCLVVTRQLLTLSTIWLISWRLQLWLLSATLSSVSNGFSSWNNFQYKIGCMNIKTNGHAYSKKGATLRILYEDVRCVSWTSFETSTLTNRHSLYLYSYTVKYFHICVPGLPKYSIYMWNKSHYTPCFVQLETSVRRCNIWLCVLRSIIISWIKYELFCC